MQKEGCVRNMDLSYVLARRKKRREVPTDKDGHVPANMTTAPAEGCLTRVMAAETSRWLGVSSTWTAPCEASSD